SAHQGLPVAFVLRRLLQARTLAEAVTLVTTLPHATNQHYLIGAPEGVRSFEASASDVVEHLPATPGRVLHTNHPLTAAATEPHPERHRVNSVARLKSLQGRLASGEPDLATLQAALSSCDDAAHPVCRLRDERNLAIGFTTGAIISCLTAAGVDAWF